MEVLGFVVLLIILVGLGYWLVYDGRNFNTITLVSIIFSMSSFCLFLIPNKLGYERGQIDALKGNMQYEMKISYKMVDSVYIPIDTVYVLKNNK